MDVITSKDDFNLHEGVLCRQKGDFKNAIKSYKNGLKVNPSNLVVLHEMGLAYSKLQKEKKALKYWKKLARIAPHSYLGVKAKEEYNVASQKIRWWDITSKWERIRWPIINV